MSRPNVIAIELRIDRHDDGRVYIHSPDLPGFHLAGMSLEALRADFDSVLRDLLKGNANAAVERIHYVPNLANQFGLEPGQGTRETCVVTLAEGR